MKSVLEAEVTRLLASGGELAAIVRARLRARALLAAADAGETEPVERLSVLDAQALCVEAANDADMRLSGEYRASGRPAEIGAGGLALLREVLAAVDLPGLALSSTSPIGEARPEPILGFSALRGSFRLDAPARRLDPVRPRD